jgi:hypothetical protein
VFLGRIIQRLPQKQLIDKKRRLQNVYAFLPIWLLLAAAEGVGSGLRRSEE